jgi:hypothetical protein
MRNPLSTSLGMSSGLLWALLLWSAFPARAWIQYAGMGNATMTHYTMAEGTITACGCTGDRYVAFDLLDGHYAYVFYQHEVPYCGALGICIREYDSIWPFMWTMLQPYPSEYLHSRPAVLPGHKSQRDRESY